MTVTLNIPPDMEKALLAEAKSKGVSIDEWVGRLVLAQTHALEQGYQPHTSRLWDLRKDLTLDDVSIQELISEGRG